MTFVLEGIPSSGGPRCFCTRVPRGLPWLSLLCSPPAFTLSAVSSLPASVEASRPGSTVAFSLVMSLSGPEFSGAFVGPSALF